MLALLCNFNDRVRNRVILCDLGHSIQHSISNKLSVLKGDTTPTQTLQARVPNTGFRGRNYCHPGFFLSFGLPGSAHLPITTGFFLSTRGTGDPSWSCPKHLEHQSLCSGSWGWGVNNSNPPTPHLQICSHLSTKCRSSRNSLCSSNTKVLG